MARSATFQADDLSAPTTFPRPPRRRARAGVRHGARTADHRDRRRSRHRDPDRDRRVRQRIGLSARDLRHRPGGSPALGTIPARGHRRGGAAALACRGCARRRMARARRRCGGRRVDAPAARRPCRGPLRAGRRGACRHTGVDPVHRDASAVPFDRARDRRRDLREAYRRRRRVLDAHCLRLEAGNSLPARRGRCRRRGPSDRRQHRRAAPVAALVAGRHAHRVRLARTEKTGRLRAEPRDRRTDGHCGVSRQQQLARLGARRKPPRGDAVARRGFAAVPR